MPCETQNKSVKATCDTSYKSKCRFPRKGAKANASADRFCLSKSVFEETCKTTNSQIKCELPAVLAVQDGTVVRPFGTPCGKSLRRFALSLQRVSVAALFVAFGSVCGASLVFLLLLFCGSFGFPLFWPCFPKPSLCNACWLQPCRWLFGLWVVLCA